MEVCILKSLEFRMNPNTPIFWINYYTKLWDDYLIDKGINALFKERSNESYFRYRELIQFYDLCLIDYRY
jgi:cyclin E